MSTPNSTAHTTSACIAAMLVVSSASSPAHAAPEATAARPEHHATKHRRLRVHMDSELLGGAWVRRTNPGPNEGRDSVSFGGGLGRPSLLDDGSALVTRPVFGLGLGYLFEGNRALVGAKGSLTLDAYGIGDATRLVAFGGRVVPYVQWIFRPGDTVRPWVEARAGVGALRTVRHDPLMGRSASRVVYPIVGAGAGVHLFPRDWFSLDVGLNLDYAAPLMRTDGDAGTSAWAKRADVLGFGMLLGVSTWF
jgi:hypothetical protein